MSLFRPAVLISVAAIALVGVVALPAGWWFVVREDDKLATSAPAIPTELVGSTTPSDATTVPAAPNDDALTFRVIPERSEAAYFAGETLARLSVPSTAKGATNEIEGAFHLTPDGLALAPDTVSEFSVQLGGLTSDEDRRDNRVRDALEVARFPEATFTVASVTGYDPAIPDGDEQTLELTGTLDLHGVRREVTWDVQARRQGGVFTALATVNFRYDDFNITPPNIAGFVSVGEDVTLQVQIVAQAEA
jgi:polyisoprenoid-binding protein YceI